MNRLTPLALEGIRVVDLTDVSSVYATKILCDLGAEVIRVEPPAGDALRRQPPFDEETGQSLFHAFMNVNKRSVTLDLDQPSGQELFRRLVVSADIVVESCPVGALDARGVGYRAIAADCPRLVWVAVTPFGSSGPRADWLADDLVSQAMGGLMTLNGRPDREPLRLFGEQSCYIAGLHAAAAALMAYWYASAGGEGQFVDTSVHECIAHTLENAIQYYTTEGVVRGRTLGRSEPGAGIFECSDGGIFMVAGLSMISSSWNNLVALLQREGIEGADELAQARWSEPAWRRTPEARDIATEVISRFTRVRTKNQVYDTTQQHHILSAPMNKIGGVFDNAQLKFLQWFEEQHWDGGRSVVWPGSPVRLSETPRRAPLVVAAAGADTEDVTAELEPSVAGITGGGTE